MKMKVIVIVKCVEFRQASPVKCFQSQSILPYKIPTINMHLCAVVARMLEMMCKMFVSQIDQ